MSRYVRSHVAGGTFFFTVVTHDRRPVLCHEPVRRALRQAVLEVCSDRPFLVLAWVLLPDHLHCVWELPPGDGAFSSRWSAIKRLTSKRLGVRTAGSSRQARRELGLWQRRFWEHTIRDERDLGRHVDYVHWNPVKHGLVDAPERWPFSTFHRFVKRGLYDAGWRGGSASAVGSSAGE